MRVHTAYLDMRHGGVSHGQIRATVHAGAYAYFTCGALSAVFCGHDATMRARGHIYLHRSVRVHVMGETR